MKKLQYRATWLLLILCTCLTAVGQKPRLEYMQKKSMEELANYAERDHKPLLLFVHSSQCASSRKFIREVMNKNEVIEKLKSSFICMNADIALPDGQKVVRKYGLLMMPALILTTGDKGFDYQCKLYINAEQMLQQIEGFLSVNSIKKQWELLKSTSALKDRECLQAIATSYARRDYRNSIGGSPKDNASRYTLGLRSLKDFESGYMMEWQKMVAVPQRKEEIKTVNK